MEKEYSNEMRGALWVIPDSERKDKGPVAKGTSRVTLTTCRSDNNEV